jgi:hypothetical protein
MSLAQQGFYTGYLCKSAEDTEDRDDLPRKTWWNLLPGHAMEEAGRGKALFQAQDKKPPFSVKHPVLNLWASGAAGAVAGGATGAGVAVALDGDGTADIQRAGAVIGGGVGALFGAALAITRSLKRTQEEAKSLEDQGLTKEISEKARTLLEEKAKKSRVLHALGGFLGSLGGATVGPANVMRGRTSQLRKLTGDTEPDKARLVAGLGHLPYAKSITDTIQGWKSVSNARKSIAR